MPLAVAAKLGKVNKRRSYPAGLGSGRELGWALQNKTSEVASRH